MFCINNEDLQNCFSSECFKIKQSIGKNPKETHNYVFNYFKGYLYFDNQLHMYISKTRKAMLD